MSALRTRRYGPQDTRGLTLERGPRGSRASGVPSVLSPTLEQRPQNRGECPTARPCPWAGCRYHLAVEVSTSGRVVQVREGWEEHLDETCALDVAGRGPTALREIDRLLGLQWGEAQRVFERVAMRLRELQRKRTGGRR